MARRRYLIAYDIANPRRLRSTIVIMESYGERLQYSVFLCDLNGSELALWERDIHRILSLAEDSVVVIDLGRPDDAAIRCIGVPRTLPASGAAIV